MYGCRRYDVKKNTPYLMAFGRPPQSVLGPHPKALRVQVPNRNVSTQIQKYGSKYGNPTYPPSFVPWTLRTSPSRFRQRRAGPNRRRIAATPSSRLFCYPSKPKAVSVLSLLVWYSMVNYGMVEYGMVYYGMV